MSFPIMKYPGYIASPLCHPLVPALMNTRGLGNCCRVVPEEE